MHERSLVKTVVGKFYALVVQHTHTTPRSVHTHVTVIIVIEVSQKYTPSSSAIWVTDTRAILIRENVSSQHELQFQVIYPTPTPSTHGRLNTVCFFSPSLILFRWQARNKNVRIRPFEFA